MDHAPSSQRRHHLVGLAILALATSGFVAVPASASPSANESFANRIESILAELPDAHRVFEKAAPGIAKVPLVLDEGIEVVGSDGRRLLVELPNAGEGRQGIPLRDGAVAYAHDDNFSTVPVPKSDGSVQILTVIDSESAPSEYRFSLDVPADATVQRGESGALAFVSRDGTLIAGVSEPWAVDADGRNVPTHYEFDGTTITQVVEHSAELHSYPVVADPWLGIDLYGSPYVSFPSGGYSINVTPTAWGESFSSVNNVGMWWAHRDEVVTKLGSSSWRWTTSIQEQFYCHIAGYPLGLPEYNMESWRPLVYWESSLLFHECNP